MKLERQTLFKALLLLAFVIAALLAYRIPFVQQHLSQTAIQSLIAGFGIWAPLVFVLIFALGVMLLVPGTVFTIIGAIAFGPWLGTLLNVIGGTLGAAGAFYIARSLGRDIVQHFFEKKALQKYDDKLEKHGFATIFYLRITFFPLTPLNYGAGLTKVRFKDYFFGTVLGIIPVTLVVTVLIGKIALMHSLSDLLTWDVFIVIGVFIFWLFIPYLFKRYFRKRSE